MSKRTRHSDNSKRQQPVQQQRAQAAARQLQAGKQGKAADRDDAGSQPAKKRSSS